MIVFPNCKINLGLHIIGKRNDGYHYLETVFYPLPFTDMLEAISADNFKFTTSGVPIESEPANNLCLKALHLLQKDFPQCTGLKLHLHKAIPIGAGLGGGSADAAFTLVLMNRKFNLGLTTEKLLDYALQLGSDCPFFIINQPCFASGRGEFLQKINLSLEDYSFLVVNPGITVSTTRAYSQLKPSTPAESIKQLIQQPPETWKNILLNDFEKPVFEAHSEIRSIKETLYHSGAIYASMSGSGSTVFGMFRKKQLPQIFDDKQYLVKKIE